MDNLPGVVLHPEPRVNMDALGRHGSILERAQALVDEL